MTLYRAPEKYTYGLAKVCERARQKSLNSDLTYYVIVNPDYPERGSEYTIATEEDLDTYYYCNDVEIVAVYCEGYREG